MNSVKHESSLVLVHAGGTRKIKECPLFRNLKIEIQGLLHNIKKLEEKMTMDNKLCSLFLAER